MIKVIFVCLGNICRSPLAEGIFKQLVKEKKLDHLISIDSAGTSNYHIGEPPDPRTVANAKLNNIILTHYGRQFLSKDLNEYDYILAMDRSNFNNILRLSEKGKLYRSKIMLMRDFDPIKDTIDVPDPYYGGDEGFQNVFDILWRSSQHFLNFIIKEHQLNSMIEKP
jgi:protein-tyrosine phosphatase